MHALKHVHVPVSVILVFRFLRHDVIGHGVAVSNETDSDLEHLLKVTERQDVTIPLSSSFAMGKAHSSHCILLPLFHSLDFVHDQNRLDSPGMLLMIAAESESRFT